MFCVVGMVSRRHFLIGKPSRYTGEMIAKLGTDVTVAESFSESGFGDNESGSCIIFVTFRYNRGL